MILEASKQGRYWLTEHAKARMEEKNISKRDVGDCVQHGDLVEFNDEESGTRRTLWRNHGICVVLDLDTGAIVTVFRNGVWDGHKTLDRTAYHWGMVPTAVLRGIK